MKSILDQIERTKKCEIQQMKKRFRYSDFESMPLFHSKPRSLRYALQESSFGIIAEFKRKSPSAGLINPHATPSDIAKKYQQLGAVAISCLTDFTYFNGSLKDLKEIRLETDLPILRKDFILDELQIFEAKAFGADAILLISELLEPTHAKHLTIIAQSLGMDVVMEAHDREHLAQINELVDVIGINNRNLHTQNTDIQTSLHLYDFIPKNRICISESGVQTKSDLATIESIGFHGALVGEYLMKGTAENDLFTKFSVACL